MATNTVIRQARERLGLSPQQLDEAIGVISAHAYDLESYEDEVSQTLSMTELNHLCGILRLTSWELLEQLMPEHFVSPSELRDCILEDCRRRTLTVDQFGDQVGWDVQGLIRAPEEYLAQLNWNGLQDICLYLGIDPISAIPSPLDTDRRISAL